jgi:hypothetical protein
MQRDDNGTYQKLELNQASPASLGSPNQEYNIAESDVKLDLLAGVFKSVVC